MTHLRPGALALVFLGGIVGTASRYGLEEAFPHHGTGWPTGTFVANMLGAFALGLLLEALVRLGDDTGRRRDVRLLLGVGFCGAFTTYSTLALEISLFVRDDAVGMAVLYGVVSVLAGLVAVWLGIVTATALVRRGVES
ncbi:fluoride efflux transporter CrcB [Williamsia deligens]|uniref:Fluoride-specific ion channel FluC n=1 Tax=Williamsia deligens TaxID=321325 RepID=A0ABW3GAB3_9NOCA|nr:fluoride efflux transporter CrcB [Williamsia deligens]MCP2193304.1 CrcB protein [Williamsia deligens]